QSSLAQINLTLSPTRNFNSPTKSFRHRQSPTLPLFFLGEMLVAFDDETRSAETEPLYTADELRTRVRQWPSFSVIQTDPVLINLLLKNVDLLIFCDDMLQSWLSRFNKASNAV